MRPSKVVLEPIKENVSLIMNEANSTKETIESLINTLYDMRLLQAPDDCTYFLLLVGLYIRNNMDWNSLHTDT